MKNGKLTLAATISALIFSLTAAAADQPGAGLVKVDLQNVAKELATNLKVNPSLVPSVVEIIPRVASDVCQLKEEVLAVKGASCTAKIITPALELIVDGLIKGMTK